jgi:hypothetical protein
MQQVDCMQCNRGAESTFGCQYAEAVVLLHLLKLPLHVQAQPEAVACRLLLSGHSSCTPSVHMTFAARQPFISGNLAAYIHRIFNLDHRGGKQLKTTVTKRGCPLPQLRVPSPGADG